MRGIFGGAFDPIHYGHLRTAEEVRIELDLKAVHFVPLRTPVHRPKPQASAVLREAIVEAALADNPYFVMDRRELRENRPSYSLYTLESFRDQYPDETLCLIIGDDTFANFLDWHQPWKILDLAHLVVMKRPGSVIYSSEIQHLLDQHQVHSKKALILQRAGKVIRLDVSQLEIASTTIREHFAHGKSTRYLLPDNVRKLCEDKELYKERSK